jgi:trigger factor
MSYTVQEINGCTKKMAFNFESLDLTNEIDQAVKEKQKTMNLKGFRKGKAPLDMVKKMYGPQLESDALNKFVQKEVFDAIKNEDLKVVGYPSFENVDYDPGKKVSFDALVEIFPSVDVQDLSGYSFEKDKVEINDKDIEEMKKNYLSSKAEMVEIEDESTELANGHFAVLNFQGVKEDGERPENMKGEEFMLEIGSNQFIPGFEEAMVGMKKAEKKEIPLNFPAEYHVEELKNSKVTFEVELLEIKEKRFPELNDELAKEFGYESVDDFMTKNTESLKEHKDRAAKEKLNQAILEKVVQDNAFDVPQALVDQQKEYLKQDLTGNLKQQGFTDDMVKEYFEKWTEDLDTKATFQVRSGLILDNLAKKFEVETTEADIDKKIQETAKSSGLDPEQIKQYYTSDEKLKKNLTYAIREEKTFDKIHDVVAVK